MMRGTAVGATWDALEEFNEALSFGWVNFEAGDYSSIVNRFSPQNHKLIGRCRGAISKAVPGQGSGTNRIKRLGTLGLSAGGSRCQRDQGVSTTTTEPAIPLGYLHPAAPHYNARLLRRTLRAAPIV